jgi:hypothetical protein
MYRKVPKRIATRMTITASASTLKTAIAISLCTIAAIPPDSIAAPIRFSFSRFAKSAQGFYWEVLQL